MRIPLIPRVKVFLLSGKEIVYSKTEEDSFNSGYQVCIGSDSIVLATHQYGLPCNIEAIAAKFKEVGSCFNRRLCNFYWNNGRWTVDWHFW